MTECLHARSYHPAVAYRGQRVWGKGRWRGARANGGKITLLPTHLHLHPQYRNQRYQLGGWLAAYLPSCLGVYLRSYLIIRGPQHTQLGFCSVPAEPHDLSALTTHSLLLPFLRQVSRPNIKPSFSVPFPHLSQTRTHARIPSSRSSHQPVTDKPVFVASCSADAMQG